MYVNLLVITLCAIIGFKFGKKAHLKQVASVLLQMGTPGDQVDKVVHLVSNYNKIQREAKKETTSAYKKLIVERQLENIKKEDKL